MHLKSLFFWRLHEGIISHEILLTLVGIFGFFSKNSQFSLALGGLRPTNQPILWEKWCIRLCIGSQPTNFRENLKGRGKFRKKSQRFHSGRGLGPPPPELQVGENFQLFLYICPNPRKKIHQNFQTWSKFLNFTLLISTNFLKIFLASGGSAPLNPNIASRYYIHYFSHMEKL